jgi:hypothetical protein
VGSASSNPTGSRERIATASRGAAAGAQQRVDELVDAVSELTDRAIDRVLLTGERVTSAAEGKRLLSHQEDVEQLTDTIQRVVVLATPVVRTVARGAKLTRIPWVMVASTATSIGVAVRTGVRELQVLAALVAHRLELATGTPADPELVKKLTIDLYLDPKRAPDLSNDRLRLVRLTRRWLISGAFGRDTSKVARKALDAAERFDAHATHRTWIARRPGKAPPALSHAGD